MISNVLNTGAGLATTIPELQVKYDLSELFNWPLDSFESFCFLYFSKDGEISILPM